MYVEPSVPFVYRWNYWHFQQITRILCCNKMQRNNFRRRSQIPHRHQVEPAVANNQLKLNHGIKIKEIKGDFNLIVFLSETEFITFHLIQYCARTKTHRWRWRPKSTCQATLYRLPLEFKSMIAWVYYTHNIVLQFGRSKYDVTAERRDWYSTRDFYSVQRCGCYWAILYIALLPWEFHARLIKDWYLHETE